MATKMECRLGSDSDYLSRMQLQEVMDRLAKTAPKVSVRCIEEEKDSREGARSFPNSPARLAALMKNLLSGRYDALVVNAASLPPRLPSGLCLAAITGRLTPYDVMISTEDEILDELPQNASVIANDLRQQAQLLYYRPDLKIMHAKGSVDSLIQKVKSSKANAVILAAADIERLQKQDYVAEVFTNAVCVPPAGQGSLAVLIREGEDQWAKAFQGIHDPASFSEIKAEWAFLDALSLGESDPVGVLGSIEGRKVELEGMLALPDGSERIRSSISGSSGKEEELGRMLAEEILDAGGKEILQELNLR